LFVVLLPTLVNKDVYMATSIKPNDDLSGICRDRGITNSSTPRIGKKRSTDDCLLLSLSVWPS